MLPKHIDNDQQIIIRQKDTTVSQDETRLAHKLKTANQS